MSTLASIGEFGVIQLLTEGCQQPAEIRGPGDDCAIVAAQSVLAGKSLLFTADALVENIHFRRSYFSPEDLGWKLLAVSVSDVAAMGGLPYAYLTTVQLPPGLEREWVTGFTRGLRAADAHFGTHLLGGDTVSGKEISLSLMLIGYLDSLPICRSGALAGDDLWVTGQLGLARLGLLACEGNRQLSNPELQLAAIERFKRPEPRLAMARALRGIANSMIDLSDGLFQDLNHLLTASGLSCAIDAQSLPLPQVTLGDGVTVQELVSGGEDFELLFTAPSAKRAQVEQLAVQDGMIALTRIGEITAGLGENPTSEERVQLLLKGGGFVGSAAWLKDGGAGRGGFDHFS